MTLIDQEFKRLKKSRKFKPCKIDRDDELCPNGIFEFNITKMLSFIRANPALFTVGEVALDSLYEDGDKTHLDEETIKTADLSRPIILAQISPFGVNTIDGNHRVEKGRRLELEMILAYKIYPAQHTQFLTSEKAYETYIDYWNEKIKTLN